MSNKNKNKLTKSEKYLSSIQWKPIIIDGKETNYEVSNIGFVRNITYNRLLEGSHDSRGYKIVSIYIGKKLHSKKVHRLVAQAFIPNPENKPTVNHKDGNKNNNAVSNLEWATHQENIDHAIATGLRDISGMKASSNIYTDEQVHKVCKMLEDGKSARYIAESLGININLPRRILYLGKWKHISSQYKLPTVKKLDENMKNEVKILIKKNMNDDAILNKLKLVDNNFSRHFISTIRSEVVKGSSTIDQLGHTRNTVPISQ